MKFTKDGSSCEVILSCADVAYSEYESDGELESARSCYIGVTDGQKLQIHLRYVGHWQRRRADILVDGQSRRFVNVRGSRDEQDVVKYVDEVWCEHEQDNVVGFVNLVFKDTRSSSRFKAGETTLPAPLASLAGQGSVSVVVYDPIETYKTHQPAFATFLQSKKSQASTVSPLANIPTLFDQEKTFAHHIAIEATRGSCYIPRLYSDGERPGARPWATFTFHYRDKETLQGTNTRRIDPDSRVMGVKLDLTTSQQGSLRRPRSSLGLEAAVNRPLSDTDISSPLRVMVKSAAFGTSFHEGDGFASAGLPSTRDVQPRAMEGASKASEGSQSGQPEPIKNAVNWKAYREDQEHGPRSVHAERGIRSRKQESSSRRSEELQTELLDVSISRAAQKRRWSVEPYPPPQAENDPQPNSRGTANFQVQAKRVKLSPLASPANRDVQSPANEALPVPSTSPTDPHTMIEGLKSCHSINARGQPVWDFARFGSLLIDFASACGSNVTPETPQSPTERCESATAYSKISSTTDISDLRPQTHTVDPRRHRNEIATTSAPSTQRVSTNFVQISLEAYTARLTTIAMPDTIARNDEYASNTKIMGLEKLLALQRTTRLAYDADLVKVARRRKESMQENAVRSKRR